MAKIKVNKKIKDFLIKLANGEVDDDDYTVVISYTKSDEANKLEKDLTGHVENCLAGSVLLEWIMLRANLDRVIEHCPELGTLDKETTTSSEEVIHDEED